MINLLKYENDSRSTNKSKVYVSQRSDINYRFICFDELADIVGHIDFDKVNGGEHFIALVNLGMILIEDMMRAQISVGLLPHLFAKLQILQGQLDLLPDVIDRMHEEIIRLLGEDASRIYRDE
ncbi:MAG: hypothetical protein Q8S46_01705 [Methylotenera sp.]|nr:hypothetical protein [Methylotenera sp.]MDP1960379.1 hypothetical protein [Methylotenera sp.]MDP3302852.1 hypothetical protein [Methylotenera sp.]MDP3942340.1 hypothetical protein [Methylotenera sp.]